MKIVTQPSAAWVRQPLGPMAQRELLTESPPERLSVVSAWRREM